MCYDFLFYHVFGKSTGRTVLKIFQNRFPGLRGFSEDYTLLWRTYVYWQVQCMDCSAAWHTFCCSVLHKAVVNREKLLC
jgi:hypothetical protein